MSKRSSQPRVKVLNPDLAKNIPPCVKFKSSGVRVATYVKSHASVVPDGFKITVCKAGEARGIKRAAHGGGVCGPVSSSLGAVPMAFFS